MTTVNMGQVSDQKKYARRLRKFGADTVMMI